MTIAAGPAYRRSALLYVIAAAIHALCAAAALFWLASDWKAQWADETFVHAVYLSYGGMLIAAFGKWVLMTVLLLYLGATALLLAASAALFRFRSHGRMLSACSYLSLVALPVGTFAAVHALRTLRKAAAETPR